MQKGQGSKAEELNRCNERGSKRGVATMERRQKPCGNLRLKKRQQGTTVAVMDYGWPDQAKRLAHEPFRSVIPTTQDSRTSNSGVACGIFGWDQNPEPRPVRWPVVEVPPRQDSDRVRRMGVAGHHIVRSERLVVGDDSENNSC